MRLWIIVGVTVMNASAQDRTAPPAISSTRNLGCEARTGGVGRACAGRNHRQRQFER
jgi:hypothetical protein